MSPGRTAFRTAAAGLAVAALAATSASFPDTASAGPPAGFSLEPIAVGFDQPTAFAHAPDGRVFVAEKPGVVKVVSSGSVSTFLDLRDRTNEFWNRGLIGLALDPDFADNRRVYLAFSEELNPSEPDGPPPAGGLIVRVEESATAPNTAAPATETTLLDGFQSLHFSHSVGGLRFDAQGRLLAALGDGASFFQVDPFALEALNLDSLQGKLVRIDPETGHGVPDNPHFDAGAPASPRSRSIAWGLRNPYRFSVDAETGDVWLGDVGWTSWDELNRLSAAPSGDAERNFGWPCSEGTALQDQYPNWFPTQCDTALAGGWSRPDHAWRTGATASTGGPIYRGSAYPEAYRGSIFFADFSSDQMMTFDPATGTAADFGAPEGWGGPVDMRIGPDGNLHILGFLDGTLRRLVHTGEVAAPQSAAPPPAAATPEGPAWPGAKRVSAQGAAGRFADLAVNRRGQAVAAWMERVKGHTRVVATLRGPGGSWHGPVPISRAGGGARDPSVAIGEGGHAIVTWRQPTGRVRTAGGKRVPRYIMVARRAHARVQQWQEVTELRVPGRAGRARAAVDRLGNAFLTWRVRRGKNSVAMGAVGRRGRGRLAARPIASPRGCDAGGPPAVVATPNGRALAWWSCGSDLAVADRRPGAGVFARARAVSIAGRGRLDAGFTLGRDGAAFGAAARSHGRSPVHALARPAQGDAVVRAADLSSDGARLSIAEHGEDSLVAWRRKISAGGVRVAVAGRSGAPSGQSTFDAGHAVSAPVTDVGPDGIGVVAWIRGRGSRAAVVAAVRPSRGVAWTRPAIVARGRIDRSRPPVVAVDGAGRITALWSRKVGKRFVVERADLPRSALG